MIAKIYCKKTGSTWTFVISERKDWMGYGIWHLETPLKVFHSGRKDYEVRFFEVPKLGQ